MIGVGISYDLDSDDDDNDDDDNEEEAEHCGGNLKVKREMPLRLKINWSGLLNGISTPYELFNAEIWIIWKCLILIITVNVQLQRSLRSSRL